MKLHRIFANLFMAMTLVSVVSCNTEEAIPQAEGELTDSQPGKSEIVKGLFILSEGNMGSNNCTLDYFDCTNGYYQRNIYSERNPTIPLGLGDAGNNIAIYENKIYALISNFIEIMDAKTATHLGSIDLGNCRDIKFYDGKAYVSSYNGPFQEDTQNNIGKVVEIDTSNDQITREVVVGYQPEEMVIKDGKLYVANSGGYLYPNYDRTVSVIDLSTFEVVKTIDVAINLHRMEIDHNGKIYVSSRGDYSSIKSDIFVIDSNTDMVVDTLGINVSEMCMDDNKLYIISNEWSNETSSYSTSYTLYDVDQNKVMPGSFITDGTEKNITTPYGIAVNPENKEIFIADATDYTTPGYIFCFTSDGQFKWKVRAGNIPGHFAFTTQTLE